MINEKQLTELITPAFFEAIEDGTHFYASDDITGDEALFPIFVKLLSAVNPKEIGISKLGNADFSEREEAVAFHNFVMSEYESNIAHISRNGLCETVCYDSERRKAFDKSPISVTALVNMSVTEYGTEIKEVTPVYFSDIAVELYATNVLNCMVDLYEFFDDNKGSLFTENGTLNADGDWVNDINDVIRDAMVHLISILIEK